MSDVETIERVPSGGPALEQREPTDVDVSAQLAKMGITSAKGKTAAVADEPPEPEPEPKADEPAETPEGERPSKRAKSQDAGPEDVPRIRELTAKWRTEEAARKALEARLAEIEARVPAPPTPQPEVPQSFTTPRPELGNFKTYEDWIEALQDWKIAKHTAIQQAATDRQAQEKQLDNDARAVRKTFHERALAFMEQTPEYDDALKADDVVHTPAMQAAILTAENGPALAFWLAKSKKDALRYVADTEGRPVTETYVAALQRLMTAEMGAAPSGSARQPQTVSRATKPIKPVGGSPTVPEPELADVSVDELAARYRKNKSFLRR
jgi:hypothetical protein